MFEVLFPVGGGLVPARSTSSIFFPKLTTSPLPLKKVAPFLPQVRIHGGGAGAGGNRNLPPPPPPPRHPPATASDDTNHAYSPCSDAKVQRSDGFAFGLAFSRRDSFFSGNGSQAVQLSPCDSRLGLAGSAQLAVLWAKVDEISLPTVNTTASSFRPESVGGYMVAFAGRKYAARSIPTFVANETYTITSFTLVLEFKKGVLQNLYWKRDSCASCSGNSGFVCLNKADCAMRTASCKTANGDADCSLGIQVTFSGTDKHDTVLNSWYEVSNLRQYSLYGLYSNLKDSLTSEYNRFM